MESNSVCNHTSDNKIGRPHFTSCSSVWHSCVKEDSDRFERLHEKALRYVFNDFCKGYDSLCSKVKVMKVYESAKILTNVQTFRDCVLHQWSARYELRPRGWHVPSRKMRRISCLFLCLFPSQNLIPQTSTSVAVCPLELKCSATGKPGAFLWMPRRCSLKCSLRLRPVSPM